MKKQLSFQPGARRLAVALALCAALLLCLGQAAHAQTAMLEGLTFTLPDAFEKDEDASVFDCFVYRIGNGSEYHELVVGSDHCCGREKSLGLTLDWIYDQLENGGEYMQNLINGQPTLFLQAVNEEVGVSYSLVATMMNGIRVVGFEKQFGTAQPIGDILLEVISSAESYTPPIRKGVASVTPEPTAELGLGQKETIKGLTFTLPDTFKPYTKTKNNDAFIYRVEDDSHHVLQALAVGIGFCYDEQIRFGVSLDWIYEQLDKGDSEYVQNLIHGQPTLFLQEVDKERGTSNALAAIKRNGLYIIGSEIQRTTQPAGDLLLEVLGSVEDSNPQEMQDVSSTPEPTAEPTAAPTAQPSPTPRPAASNDALFSHSDHCEDTSHHQTRLNYLGDPGERKASDDFLFCGIDWDTDLDTALRIISANTNRTMEDAGNGSYMGMSYGSPFWGLNDDACFLTLITVVPEEDGWWVECQLTPEQIEFADEGEAASWFHKLWISIEGYKHNPSTYTLEVDGEALSVMDPEELIDMWQDAVIQGCESAYAVMHFNNLTLSLEKAVYEDMSYISCWLTLEPGVR